MPYSHGDEQLKNEIEMIARTDSEIKEVISPEEANVRYSRIRKRCLTVAFMAVLILEVIVTVLFSGIIRKNDLQRRILREYEKRSTGSIRLKTGTYSGETDFGYFFGEGLFDFDSGAEYDGNWINNALTGRGELKVPIEGVYIGDFRDSLKNGQGVFSWDDGSAYDGEWKDDKMSGQGVYTSADAVVYQGTFCDNSFSDGDCMFRNDTGIYHLIYKNGKIDHVDIRFTDGSKYLGSADEKTLTGNGRMIFINGDVYEGGWLNGIRNGSGKYIWASDDTYDGEWKDDKMSGTGKFVLSNGGMLQGLFENNRFVDGSYQVVNDFGNYTFSIKAGIPVAVNMVLPDGTEYLGDLDDERLNGHAQIKYSNGDVYDGNVADGTKSGFGTYTWESGSSYDGIWAEDQMSGRGTYMYPKNESGYKLVGEFKDGLPDGECQYYVTDTKHYKTDWKKGKCIKIYE